MLRWIDRAIFKEKRVGIELPGLSFTRPNGLSRYAANQNRVGRLGIVGFHLVDLGNDDHYTSVNFWNWRPTVELIRSFGIIDDERLELLGTQCVGAQVTEAEATAIAKRLETEILASLPEDGRVLLDSSVTSEPDDGTFHRDGELEKNYSASKEWLLRFVHFCRSSNGFSVT